MKNWIVSAIAVVTAISCASNPMPIPVAGGSADLTQLAGEWNGEYHSLAGGRRGTIAFSLEAGADSAFGGVLMFPQQNMVTARGETHTEAAPPNMPHSLSISFVRAADGRVTGRLDPYQDPECGCMVNTIFEGRLEGDVIEGTYVAQRSGASSMNGEWKVTRRK